MNIFYQKAHRLGMRGRAQLHATSITMYLCTSASIYCLQLLLLYHTNFIIGGEKIKPKLILL